MTKTVLLASVVLTVFVAVAVRAGVIDPVISSNDPLPFPRDSENEPALALDRNNTVQPGPLLVAGGNDYHDQDVCPPTSTSCEFTSGIGISGLYYSDTGTEWKLASYTSPTGAEPITTLPNFPKGLWSAGDPGVAAGPRPSPRGKFSWAYGTRFYYVSLARQGAKTSAMITVSSSDPSRKAALALPDWKPPVRVSTPGADVDKPAIWVDATAGKANPSFGHAYVCWTEGPSGRAPSAIKLARSVDGGVTWTPLATFTPAAGYTAQGCAIRTGHTGKVYVFWSERVVKASDSVLVRSMGVPCSKLMASRIMMAASSGTDTFAAPTQVTAVREPGRYDPTQGSCTVDGAAGARTNGWASVDIASGAPLASVGFRDKIAVAWVDGENRVLAMISSTEGATWSQPFRVSSAGAKAVAFPAVALSPKARKIYVFYDWFVQSWQRTTAAARTMVPVVRVGDVAKLPDTVWGEVRGVPGDARGASGAESENKDRPGLAAEFLGDYNAIVATNTQAYAAWTDLASAVNCKAVDDYRQGVIVGHAGSAPNAAAVCGKVKGSGSVVRRFGNTTLCGVVVPAAISGIHKSTVCATQHH